MSEYIIEIARDSVQFLDAVEVDIPNDFLGGHHTLNRSCLKDEIIRCRDCRFSGVEDGAIKRMWCDRMDKRKQHYMHVDPEGFCSWGQRREDPCRNTDENPAAFAAAPTLRRPDDGANHCPLALGA